MSTVLPPTPPAPMNEEPSLPAPQPSAPPVVVAAGPSSPTNTHAHHNTGSGTHRANPLRLMFPELVTSFRAGRWMEVTVAGEEAELAYTEFSSSPTRLLLTIPLVLAYFAANDLPPARFALFRLPTLLQNYPLSRALFDLWCALQDRAYPSIYALATRLPSVVQGALPDDPELDVAIGPLVDGFLSAYRQRTLSVLSRAYTTLPLKDATTYLGLSPEDVITACKSSGWTYDEATTSLRPPSANVNGIAADMWRAPSGLGQFAGIADGAARLESVL